MAMENILLYAAFLLHRLLLSVPLKDSLSLAWRPASSLEEGAKGSGMSPKGSLLEGAGTRSVTEGVGHWVVTGYQTVNTSNATPAVDF